MSVLSSARESIGRGLARPITYVSAEWDRLAPRERRSVAALAIAVVVVGVLLSVYFVFSSIGDLQDGNAAIRKALTEIAKHRDEYMEAKSRSTVQEQRIGTEPPQLTTDLEAAAREAGVQIAESNERPVSPAGRRYSQHDVDLKIRDVDLQSLTQFMRRVETGQRLIFFSRLSLKRRYSEAEKLDVEATATAFEKLREDKDKTKSAKKPEGKDK
jgi:type II secretory pathway component PulM